jgi:hypothetical protein
MYPAVKPKFLHQMHFPPEMFPRKIASRFLHRWHEKIPITIAIFESRANSNGDEGKSTPIK